MIRKSVNLTIAAKSPAPGIEISRIATIGHHGVRGLVREQYGERRPSPLPHYWIVSPLSRASKSWRGKHDAPGSWATATLCAVTVESRLRQIMPPAQMRRCFTARQARQLLIAADFKCQRCGCDLSQRQFEAHHVRRFADGGVTELHNGMALCVPCHKEIS